MRDRLEQKNLKLMERMQKLMMVPASSCTHISYICHNVVYYYISYIFMYILCIYIYHIIKTKVTLLGSGDDAEGQRAVVHVSF